MDMLAEGASGLRHLRWAREVSASLLAHADGTSGLDPADREALREEATRLRALVDRLSAAVKPYRDFLERTRVLFRGRQRAARYAYEEAKRRAGELTASQRDEIIAAKAALSSAHDEALARLDEEQRRPLKSALRAAKGDLRGGLFAMNERLGQRFRGELIESLYPPLTRALSLVADEEDEDDDATAPPDPPA